MARQFLSGVQRAVNLALHKDQLPTTSPFKDIPVTFHDSSFRRPDKTVFRSVSRETQDFARAMAIPTSLMGLLTLILKGFYRDGNHNEEIFGGIFLQMWSERVGPATSMFKGRVD